MIDRLSFRDLKTLFQLTKVHWKFVYLAYFSLSSYKGSSALLTEAFLVLEITGLETEMRLIGPPTNTYVGSP